MCRHKMPQAPGHGIADICCCCFSQPLHTCCRTHARVHEPDEAGLKSPFSQMLGALHRIQHVLCTADPVPGKLWLSALHAAMQVQIVQLTETAAICSEGAGNEAECRKASQAHPDTVSVQLRLPAELSSTEFEAWAL